MIERKALTIYRPGDKVRVVLPKVGTAPLSNVSKIKELKVKFDQILEDLTKNNIVNWTADFTREKPIYDYKNISLKYFKILIF